MSERAHARALVPTLPGMSAGWLVIFHVSNDVPLPPSRAALCGYGPCAHAHDPAARLRSLARARLASSPTPHALITPLRSCSLVRSLRGQTRHGTDEILQARFDLVELRVEILFALLQPRHVGVDLRVGLDELVLNRGLHAAERSG